MSNMPYFIIPGERLRDLLERASNGENPNLLIAEEYANGISEQVEGDSDG